MKSLQALA